MMKTMGFTGLERKTALKSKLFFAAAVASAVSSCTSVQHTSSAQLSAIQTVVPTPKPSEVAYATPNPVAGMQASGQTATVESPVTQAVAVNAATATSVPLQTPSAYVAKASSASTAAVAAATPVAAPEASAGQPMAVAYAEMPLTAEMMAIQSVIPTPRPIQAQAQIQTPTNQLAYAGTAREMDSLSAFDLSKPVVIPEIAASSSEAPESNSRLHSLISKYSKLYEVPEALVHRVVRRESTYNPKAYHHGNYGLMQIRYNTARSLGYDGPPAGLFDAETNLKYAVKYLKGAWLVADTNHDQAVNLYARGYYYDAKRRGMLDQVQ